MEEGRIMDDDEEGNVIAMNRPRHGLSQRINPPSPGELADGQQPYGALRDRLSDLRPQPDTMPEAEEQDYLPPPKKSDPLPRPGDGYRAHARFLNRLGNDQKMIHFVDKDCWCEGYAYSDLRRVRWVKGDSPASSPVLELRFAEAVTTDVRIEGRHLEDIHYWISEGTMPWVWEQPTGFRSRDDNTVVISRITFHLVDRETGQPV